MDTDTSDSDTELTYEELRPFPCGKCCNRFITQNDLIFHTKLVHSKGLFRCSKCDFSCTGIGQMTLHNQNHIRESGNIISYKTSQNSHRAKIGHDKGSSSLNVLEDNHANESDANKENENNSSISESSSDSNDDSDSLNNNRKRIRIRKPGIKKCKKKISISNVSSATNLEMINPEGEITNDKTKIDTNLDLVQSEYNDFDSDSEFYDRSSNFDNEENNLKEKIKSSYHSENIINDRSVTNQILALNVNPDKSKKEKIVNVNRNFEKGTEIEFKDKQENVEQMRTSQQINDSENDTKYRDENVNNTQKSNEYAKEMEIKDNDKLLYNRRSSAEDSSKNEKSKPKPYSESHNCDLKKKNINDCKVAAENKVFNLDKSEKDIYPKEKIPNENSSSKKNDSKHVNKPNWKSKFKRIRSDTEKDIKLIHNSLSEKKELDSSRSKSPKERTISAIERSPDINNSKDESKDRHKLEKNNCITVSKNKDEKISSSLRIQKHNPMKINDILNKEEEKYDMNEKNIENDTLEFKKDGKIDKKKDNREQREKEKKINQDNHSKDQEQSSTGLKRKFDNLDLPSLQEKNEIKQLVNEQTSDLKFGKENQTLGIADNIKIKTEDCHNLKKRYEVGICQNESGKKTSKPMCEIPRENLKDMISNSRGTRTSENEKDYKCKTCNKTFEKSRKLKRHLTSGKCFGKGSDLMKDDKNTNDRFVTDANFPSTSKNEISPYKAQLNDDKDSKSTGISNKKSVYATDKVEKLMAKVKKIGNKFQCPECSKMLCGSGILRRHLIIHTGEMPFLCTSCDATFNQKIQLQKHMKTTHNEGMFRCEICNENFVQEIYMKRHMAKHTGINPFACSICPESFVLERDLKKHMRKDHENCEENNSINFKTDGVSSLPLNEKKCDGGENTNILTSTNYKYKYKYKFKKSNSSTEENPFICIKCNYTAVESVDFQNHLKNAHNEGIFKCKFCDKTFSEKILLKSHISQHEIDEEILNFDDCIKAEKQIFKTENTLSIETIRKKDHGLKCSAHRVPELDSTNDI